MIDFEILMFAHKQKGFRSDVAVLHLTLASVLRIVKRGHVRLVIVRSFLHPSLVSPVCTVCVQEDLSYTTALGNPCLHIDVGISSLNRRFVRSET